MGEKQQTLTKFLTFKSDTLNKSHFLNSLPIPKKWDLSIIYEIIENGKLPKLGIPKQTLSNHLKKLKHECNLQKIGYATWEIDLEKAKFFIAKMLEKEVPNKSHYDLYHTPPQVRATSPTFQELGTMQFKPKSDTFEPKSESFTIRGHAFQIEFQIPSFKGWHEREKYLIRQNIFFKPINGGQRITIRHEGIEYKTWLLDKKIITYSPPYASYYTQDASQSRNFAISDHCAIIAKLEAILKVSLKIQGRRAFKINKHHYAKINDDLAKHYNRLDKKLQVRNENGLWLLIDNSPNEEGKRTTY